MFPRCLPTQVPVCVRVKWALVVVRGFDAGALHKIFEGGIPVLTCFQASYLAVPINADVLCEIDMLQGRREQNEGFVFA